MSYVGQNPKFKNMRLLDSSNNAVTVGVPSSVTPYPITLPNVQGATGTTISNDGSGGLSWVLPGTVYAYVGTNPEPGGSSPFQLVTADHRTQVINPAGAITVKLPTTSILAGDVWTIENQSTNIVTVQSSGGNSVDKIVFGVSKYVALVNTPTLASDWRRISAESNWLSYTPAITDTTSTFSFTTVSGFYRRVGDSMDVRFDAQTGSTTGAGAIYIPPPSGFTIDASKIGSAGGLGRVGFCQTYSVETASQFDRDTGVYFSSATTTSGVIVSRPGAGAYYTGTQVGSNGEFHGCFSVPITEWA